MVVFGAIEVVRQRRLSESYRLNLQCVQKRLDLSGTRLAFCVKSVESGFRPGRRANIKLRGGLQAGHEKGRSRLVQ